MLILVLLLLIIIYFQHKGIPMFLYHQVNPISNITPELFEEHLKILKEKNMKAITLSEYGSGQSEKNSCLITLDDGYYDNYKVVYPLLKKYNMKATIFLNTLYIKDKRDRDTDFLISGEANYIAMKKFVETGDGTTDQYMTWEEIKEMYESGLVDFQAHSHKHTAIFVSDKLEGFFDGTERDITDMYLYGEVKKGYPKFRKRGEYSSKGIVIDRDFFRVFKEFYDKELEGKDAKEKIKLGQEFVDKNKERYFKYENDEDFKKRIETEFLLNKELIEKNLGNSVEYFCWPWGHRNSMTISILEKYGVKGFVTTKKGTNGKKPNYHMIRRIELRKFTPEKFRINLFIGRNYLLGKIYGWLS